MNSRFHHQTIKNLLKLRQTVLGAAAGPGAAIRGPSEGPSAASPFKPGWREAPESRRLQLQPPQRSLCPRDATGCHPHPGRAALAEPGLRRTNPPATHRAPAAAVGLLGALEPGPPALTPSPCRYLGHLVAGAGPSGRTPSPRAAPLRPAQWAQRTHRALPPPPPPLCNSSTYRIKPRTAAAAAGRAPPDGGRTAGTGTEQRMGAGGGREPPGLSSKAATGDLLPWL